MFILAANAGDILLNGFGVVFSLAVVVVFFVGVVYFVAGFIQMGEGHTWNGLNVSGFGAVTSTIASLYFYAFLYSINQMNLYQASVAGILFAGIYVLFTIILRFFALSWGIIFLLGLTFICLSV